MSLSAASSVGLRGPTLGGKPRALPSCRQRSPGLPHWLRAIFTANGIFCLVGGGCRNCIGHYSALANVLASSHPVLTITGGNGGAVQITKKRRFRSAQSK
ncbi:hypothetical protein M427DRAFT_441393 [Gonapodya prolifera JEL478]|uniref:Uncharacterized protein n=1 Tax=Gonapodya prolifera (strain JEL478) TaxID=1344416 RepID=A0A139A3Q8_GONPJ|nr:hypothetical protein M427DRAFT_441393 [Gonapodya prolifera JEL478]|eukprot:KXS11299.1 hypothetical protein M427DRAFT_441393 [Gonapodya prolifera JEL478]